MRMTFFMILEKMWQRLKENGTACTGIDNIIPRFVSRIVTLMMVFREHEIMNANIFERRSSLLYGFIVNPLMSSSRQASKVDNQSLHGQSANRLYEPLVS